MKTEVIEYVKERYSEESARFSHIESKSGQMLGLLSALFVFLGAAVSFRKDSLFEPCTNLDWAILLSLFATSIFLAISWRTALAALKLGECPVPKKDIENSDYLRTASDEEAFSQIVDCYVDTTRLLTPIVDAKARFLGMSYNTLVISAYLSALFISLVIAREFLS